MFSIVFGTSLQTIVKIIVDNHHNNMVKTAMRNEKRMLIELKHLCSPGAWTLKHHGKGPC